MKKKDELTLLNHIDHPWAKDHKDMRITSSSWEIIFQSSQTIKYSDTQTKHVEVYSIIVKTKEPYGHDDNK